MKKFFPGLLALPLLIAAQEIPSSITVTCGKTVLRLDAAKRWNINSIQVDGEQLAIDHPGAHYGMTYMPAGAKGFIGSGHTETGKVETVKNIRFFIDGKTAVPQVQMSAKNSFYMEKVSEIGDFEVTYSFNLTGGILFERTMLKTTLGVSGSNLWLLSEYMGFDPDVSTQSEDSTLRRVDMNSYPTSRRVVANVSIRF